MQCFASGCLIMVVYFKGFPTCERQPGALGERNCLANRDKQQVFGRIFILGPIHDRTTRSDAGGARRGRNLQSTRKDGMSS
jgi:hypothetical protein